MTIKEIEAKAKELKGLLALIEEAQAEVDSIKDELKAEMGERDELRAGEYKITYKPVTSAKIDATAFKKAMPDVAQAFTKKSTTRRFCLA